MDITALLQAWSTKDSRTFRGFTKAEAGLVEVLQTLNDEVDGSPVRLG